MINVKAKWTIDKTQGPTSLHVQYPNFSCPIPHYSIKRKFTDLSEIWFKVVPCGTFKLPVDRAAIELSTNYSKISK